MNSKIVNALLFIALSISIGLFYYKFNNNDDWLDKRLKTFGSLKHQLPIGSTLWVEAKQLDPQMLYSCRYIMAPIPINLNDSIQDTMLYVYPIKDTVPKINFAENNRRVYWQNQDDEYRYLLIIRRK